MDPISLSTLVGLIAKSAAGEAGKTAWHTLTTLTRRALGGSHAETALEQAKDGAPDSAMDLAGRLVQAAGADPQVAHLIHAWITQTQQALDAGTVTNTITGDARIRGDVVQARDIGTVHFGRNDSQAAE